MKTQNVNTGMESNLDPVHSLIIEVVEKPGFICCSLRYADEQRRRWRRNTLPESVVDFVSYSFKTGSKTGSTSSKGPLKESM